MSEMPKPTVAVREMSSGSSNKSLHHSLSSLSSSSSKPSPARHSCQAPLTPESSIQQRYEPNIRGGRHSKPMSPSVGYTSFDLDTPPAYEASYNPYSTIAETAKMSKRDYAIAISRLMGKQLVRGLREKPRDGSTRERSGS